MGARVALLLASWRSNYHALQQLAVHLPHTALLLGAGVGGAAAVSAAALEEEARGMYVCRGVCFVVLGVRA